MFRFLRRSARPITRPFSRSALLLLAWSQRYTLALWFKSLSGELNHQVGDRTLDLRRWRRVVAWLWRISSDPRLANSPEVRKVTVVGDSITLDATETWHGRYLLDDLPPAPAAYPQPTGANS